jgi:repressor LexA
MSLSVKQQKVLEFIRQYNRDQGYPPSVREICVGLHLKSTSTAHGYLERLERKGFIRRDPSRPRAIELIEDRSAMRDVIGVPVVGRVAAGEPLYADENIEDTLYLPLDFFRCADKETFVLRISGLSMVNAGILDGDHILVERVQTAQNGEIVVALLGEDATCKRFYKENGHFRLQPENDHMDPIIVPEVAILGKVVGLIRKY